MDLNSRGSKYGRTMFLLVVLISMHLETIVAAPTIITNGRAVEGQSYTLKCRDLSATSPLTIEWSKIGSSEVLTGVYTTKVIGGIHESSSSLTLAVSRNDDLARFVCMTTDQNGFTDSASTRLYVDVIPQPPVISGPTEVSEGETATYNCTRAEGRPPATISWKWSTGESIYNDVTPTANREADNTFTVVSEVRFVALQSYNGRSLICETSHAQEDQKQTDDITITVVYKPSVTIGKIYYEQTVGSSLTLECTVNSNPPATSVDWLKNGTAITRSSRYSNGDVSTPSLTINSVVESDTGTYVCTASNNAGTLSSDPTRVEIKSLPTVTIPGPSTYTQDLGEDVTLPCTVQANPPATRVIWSKGPISLVALNATKYGGSNTTDPSLTIFNLELSDAASYQCTAQNNYGTGFSDRTITLIINYAPSFITVTPQRQTITERSRLTLTCSSDGQPAPSYSWTSNGREVGTASTYTIISAGPADHANFTCRAYNTKGEQSNTVEIVVLYTPVVTIPLTSYGADEGQSVTIPCNFTSNPVATGVVWSKDGSNLDIPASGGKYSGGTTLAPSLTITSLTSADAGSYICGVTNAQGTGTDTTTVSIGYAPVSGTISNPSPRPVEGSAASLSCAASAAPEPVYKWYKDGVEIFTGKVLQLSSVSVSDTATYTCIATNDKGSTNATTTLDVLYTPRLSFEGDVKSVGGDDDAVIPLVIKSNPAPTRITWSKDGLPFDPTTNTRISGGTPANPQLTITNLVPGDNGVYQAVVENSIGTVRSPTINVTGTFAPNTVVIRPPKVTTNEGRPVIAECSANGSPTPTYVWFRGSTKYSVGPILSITSVTFADNSTFTCNATNAAGSSTALASIEVYYQPKITFGGAVYKKEGSNDAIVPVEINSHPAPMALTWYKNGVPFTPSPPKYSGGTPSKPELTIKDLDVTDVGLYYVEVQNDVGTAKSDNINVTGLFPPSNVVVTPSSINVLEFDNVSIDCTATGEPTPTFSWSRGGVLYSNGPRLAIASVTPAHWANFTCNAVNNAGRGTAVALINVLFKPVHNVPQDGDNTEYAADVGETVNMTCNVKSNPAPTIYRWWFNQTQLPETTSTLTVLVDTKKYGTYTCRAFNPQGESGDIRITLKDRTEPGTGASTSGGLSTTYIVLIVLIIIIILVIIIIAIIFCCTQGLCAAICGKGKKKSSNGKVEPAPVIAPATKVKPSPFISSGYTSSESTVSRQDVLVTVNGTAGGRSKSTRLRIEEDARDFGIQGTGPIISIMEGETKTPRPHQLPPLGYEPSSETPVKKMKRKRKRRPKPEAINESESAALTANQATERTSPSSDV
ncbi:hemicentin-1 [Patella vulgata]|uniref:hemicentin-1 n=1 Tax=Patella vulgata TaxID=6465 RepID=UPI0024A84692|nr:hemicentin-1 [Patella vulgata]